MKKLVPALLAATAALTAPTAMADNWYADGGYAFADVDVDTGFGSVDMDLGAIGGHVGYTATPYVALEGEVLVGVKDEDWSLDGNSASVGLNYLVGAYGKLQAPLGERTSVYARAGVVNAEVDVSATGLGSASDSDTGAGYGLGGMIDLNENIFIRGDYTRYDINEFESDTFMVGVGAKF